MDLRNHHRDVASVARDAKAKNNQQIKRSTSHPADVSEGVQPPTISDKHEAGAAPPHSHRLEKKPIADNKPTRKK